MILIPYGKYQRFTSKSTSQQDDVKEGGEFKTPIEKKRKLGPPGALVKPYDRHPKTNTSVQAETKSTWITLTFYVYFHNIVCIAILYLYV